MKGRQDLSGQGEKLLYEFETNNERFDNLIFKYKRGTQDLSGQGEKIIYKFETNNKRFDDLIFKYQRGTQDLSGQGEKIFYKFLYKQRELRLFNFQKPEVSVLRTFLRSSPLQSLQFLKESDCIRSLITLHFPRGWHSLKCLDIVDLYAYIRGGLCFTLIPHAYGQLHSLHGG